MLRLQVDKDAFEYVVEKLLGGRRFVQGVVDVVKDSQLVGGVTKLLGSRIRRAGELALGLGNNLGGGAEDGAAFVKGGSLRLDLSSATEGES